MKRALFLLLLLSLLPAKAIADNLVLISKDIVVENNPYDVLFDSDRLSEVGVFRTTNIVVSGPDKVVIARASANCSNSQLTLSEIYMYSPAGDIIEKSKPGESAVWDGNIPGSLANRAVGSLCSQPMPLIGTPTEPKAPPATVTIAKGLGKALLWLGKEYVEYNKSEYRYQQEASLARQRSIHPYSNGSRCQTIYRLRGKDPIYNCN